MVTRSSLLQYGYQGYEPYVLAGTLAGTVATDFTDDEIQTLIAEWLASPVTHNSPEEDGDSPRTVIIRPSDRQEGDVPTWNGAKWTGTPATGSLGNVQLAVLAGNLDQLLTGAITRDANGAATSASVTWPDGSPGSYAATAVSSTFPGAVDAYTVTHVGSITRTATQAAVTRDLSTGAVTNRPTITVA